MKDIYSIEQVMKMLRDEVAECGSQEEFARKADVTQQYVGDVLRGQRAPGRKILDALGLRKLILYTSASKKGA